MNYCNKAIPNPNSVDINKAIMRCLTRALSVCVPGFYIYSGEDFPEEVKFSKETKSPEGVNKRQTLITGLEEAAKKGVNSMRDFWTSLSTEDVQLIGEVEKTAYLPDTLRR